MDHLKTGHFQPFEYRTLKLSGIWMATVCLVQYAEFLQKVSMIFESK